MKLGIVCALHTEASTLLRALEISTKPASKKYRASITNHSDLSLVVSGMGSERAKLAARQLVEDGVDLLLSWGSAGGLDPELETGQLILPSKLVNDSGEENPVSDQIDVQFINLMAKDTQTTLDSSLVSVETTLKTTEEKQALFNASGAAAVDMESESIASVAREKAVACAVVRVVLDGADRCLPKFVDGAVDEFGSVKVAPLIRSLLRHPKDLLLLPSLMSESGIAMRSLRQAASCIPSVVEQLEGRP